MSKLKKGLTFLQGDIAVAEGALRAGCKFFAGYPITPATEVAEHMSFMLPYYDGNYIQMEDEIASMGACIGASYAGVKSMTATSGPGLSLMMENVGLAVMTETPLVIVDIMRAGPSTGGPTKAAQGDIMQVKWGSHGDYEIIALVPYTVQECCDLTIKAFDFAEKYRTPVFVLVDAIIGHLYEPIQLPEPEELKLIERKKPTVDPSEYLPFKPDDDLVPPMAIFGSEYEFYATGLTHNEKGYPDMEVETQLKLVNRLSQKIKKHGKDIYMTEEFQTEDAEIIIISYGVTARSALKAVQMARKEGIKVGLLRLITVWPFPEEEILKAAQSAKHLIVGEMNLGQIVREVERFANGTPVSFLGKPCDETVLPAEFMKEIKKVQESLK